MKKLCIIISGLIIMFSATINLNAQHTADVSNSEWKLIWNDEFDGKDLNQSKWNVLIRETSKHNELQYYVPDEVYLQNGCLRIRSRVRDYGSQHYTSGRINTKGKLSFTYGRIEIRGKLPTGKGMWPAYWLYPENRDLGDGICDERGCCKRQRDFNSRVSSLVY